MNLDAIVYTSLNGHTRQYAQMLGQQTGLPVHELDKAALPHGSQILYLGWIQASHVKGYAKAAKRYQV